MTKAHPTENDVKDKIKTLLDQHGWFHWPAAASQFGVGGISDRAAVRGRKGHGCIFMVIEAKLLKDKGTPRQEEFQANVREQGGIAVVVNQAGLPKFEALLVAISAAHPRYHCTFCNDSGEACSCNSGLPHKDGDFGWA